MELFTYTQTQARIITKLRLIYFFWRVCLSATSYNVLRCIKPYAKLHKGSRTDTNGGYRQAVELGEDVVGRLGPDAGLGVLVMLVEVSVGRLLSPMIAARRARSPAQTTTDTVWAMRRDSHS